MQRFYAANDSYADDRAGNPVSGQVPGGFKQSPADGRKLHDLVIPAESLNALRFEIRMGPVAGGLMGSDFCGTFALNSTGVHAVVVNCTVDTGALRDSCWK